MKLRLASMIFIISCYLISSSYISPSYSQSFWSPPFEVSPLQYGQVPLNQLERPYGWSWLPDMTLGPDGSVHIVWYGGLIVGQSEEESIDLLMYRRRNADGSWEPVRELMAPWVGGYTVRTSITFGRDGNLHMLYRANTSILYSQAPWRDAVQPQAWSEGRILTDNGYYVALAFDQTGQLHAFWSEVNPVNTSPNCYKCGELFYRRSTDNGKTWSPVVNLSQSEDGETKPQVRVDSFNRIHVVWDEGTDWFIPQSQPHYGVYRRSDDGGVTWTDPVKFKLPPAAIQAISQQLSGEVRMGNNPKDPPREAVQQIALTVDAAGNPSVVYRGVLNDRIYFQRSLDGGNSWTPAIEVPYVRARNIYDNRLDYYSLATDSADNVHLLMVGFTGVANIDTPPALIHMTFDGTRWLPPRIIMQNDLYPELPRLAIYNGNQLHAVWFTRSHLFEPDRPEIRPFYQIWHSTAQLNLPARPGLPLFTPTPIPATPTAASVAVAPTATPIALPDEARSATPMTSRPIWENTALIVIGSSLLIPITLISLIVFVRWRLTRQ